MGKDVPKEVSDYMASLAKKSWQKRKDTQDMSATGKAGAEKRWGKKKASGTPKKNKKPDSKKQTMEEIIAGRLEERMKQNS